MSATAALLLGAWLSVAVSLALGIWAVGLTMMARREMEAAEARAVARSDALISLITQALNGDDTDPEQARNALIEDLTSRMMEKLAESEKMRNVAAGRSPATGMPAWLEWLKPGAQLTAPIERQGGGDPGTGF